MGEALGGSLTGVLGALRADVLALWQGWLSYLSPEPVLATSLLGLAIAALIGFSLYRRLLAKRLDALYVAAYLAMLTLWPHPDHAQRFLLPVVPLLFMQGGLALAAPQRAAPRSWRRWAGPAYAAALLAVAAPGAAKVATRALQPVPPELAAFARTRYWLRAPSHQAALAEARLRSAVIQGLREVAPRVPRGACIYAVHPQLVMLYTHRISVPGGPRQKVECEYHYVMRSLWFDLELERARAQGKVLLRRTLADGSPVGTLVRYRR